MNNNDIPVWEKYTLTIEEASKYFRIGEHKLRRLAEENKDAGWLIMNGNRIQIKRRQFEKVIDKLGNLMQMSLVCVMMNTSHIKALYNNERSRHHERKKTG